MENRSKPEKTFSAQLAEYEKKGELTPKLKQILESFYLCYKEAVKKGVSGTFDQEELFLVFLDLVRAQIASPFTFAPYHEHIRKPFDYYKFGNEFARPLIDFPHSSVHGLAHADEAVRLLKNNENVIFLANHQTEADPQAISLLLEKSHPLLAEEMIFVAGERVVTDPLAIPFSMGRNLLCIYSKRYIDHPPEDKALKQQHNKRTMQLMSELLSQGGRSIYVAPSGGRDRKNAAGVVEVAAFDPQSIEMFYLMAQRAGRPTHFYPLTLATYDLLPPPADIQIELGEVRVTQLADIHLSFGAKIDMDHFPGSDMSDKHERRKMRANYIWNLVKEDYEKITRTR
ncbi:MAG: 1-acyl-sn-glycerol-3-phosphate acyltransferase [Chlamydiales bacterium]|nr:1-acyl-sn-glycerol-3-phosphate acyltransferase [Chlamydiales bacterium]